MSRLFPVFLGWPELIGGSSVLLKDITQYFQRVSNQRPCDPMSKTLSLSHLVFLKLVGTCKYTSVFAFKLKSKKKGKDQESI